MPFSRRRSAIWASWPGNTAPRSGNPIPASPGGLSLLLTPSGAETLAFFVSQPLPWLVAPKSVPLMTRRGDLKLSHGATAKARENAVKQDRVPTTNAIKSP